MRSESQRRSLCLVAIDAALIAYLSVSSALAVSGEDEVDPRASSVSHPHLIEIGDSVPICVFGPNFVSTCAFGGVNFHSAYMYRFHRWFAVGGFFDLGLPLVFDAGVKLRAWLFTEAFYFDLGGIFMAPVGAVDGGLLLYGFESALGLAVPTGRRVRFITEAQAPMMFSSYGFIGFFRVMIGVSISI